jgi:uncharacterized membrane protein YbjE (DUF340 family)
MFAATVVVSILLAASLVFAAVRKLSHRDDVVRAYAAAGVAEDKLDRLAVVLLAAAAGLIAGLFWAPIGVAAALGLICYFLVAIGFHIRAGDAAHLPTPIAMELLSVATLILRLATA